LIVGGLIKGVPLLFELIYCLFFEKQIKWERCYSIIYYKHTHLHIFHETQENTCIE